MFCPVLSSSFRYEKGFGDHEEADGVKICGMTAVNCWYVPLQFVYRLVSIAAAAPNVYTAVLFGKQTSSRGLSLLGKSCSSHRTRFLGLVQAE
jgi:hypothetical protein